MKTINGFRKAKSEGRPVSMATCYDYWSARILEKSTLDAILVGDSVAMVFHGYDSTVHADTDMISMHTRAVRKGAGDRFIVSDVPFPEHRKGIHAATQCADALMKAGANAVKIEGIRGHRDVIEHLVGSGVPVMGHLGLTPQSVNQLGGYKVQGKLSDDAKRLIEDALELEAAGAFGLVLECVPAELAQRITSELDISTIGIGSGAGCDGQVLVLQDLLGMQMEFKPKFLRTFMEGADCVLEAVNSYHKAVKEGSFPNSEESF